jgi:hypothetical protein
VGRVEAKERGRRRENNKIKKRGLHFGAAAGRGGMKLMKSAAGLMLVTTQTRN